MTVSTQVSQSGVCFLLGALWLAGTQTTACSARFHSCYEARKCPAEPEAEAGMTGDESSGTSDGAGRATGGAPGSERGRADEAPAESGASGTDGAGRTAPVVKCGAVDCAIGSKVCCFRRAGSATSQTCDDVADCTETFPAAEPARTPTECDEHADCPTGYLCSYVSASGGSHTNCRLAEQANVSSSIANWYEVCQSPVKTNACSGGRTCSETADAFPGWKFCAHLSTD